MKTKDKQALRSMDAPKLQSHADGLRNELARLQLDKRMGNAKDTNAVAKKKKELAIVQTFIKEKTHISDNTDSKVSK